MQITKLVQQIGNGGHIYLPKEMVGHKVSISLVEKSIEEIEGEILTILRPYLKHIEGIYLYGSYARNEETPESDIDVLVITKSEVKIEKRINEYEITCTTIEQIEKTLDNNAVLILPILKESKAILNEELIERYKSRKLNKKNSQWYIDTTESALELARYAVEEKEIREVPALVYSLILRLRGLYLIEALISGKEYSNKSVIEFLIKNKITVDKSEQLYAMYREYRDNKKISKNNLCSEDIHQLYNVVYDYSKKVRSLWERLK